MNDTRDITRHRVIIHLDLDCFYAQVEGIRLQIPDNEPIAAHQWGFVLAVNYIARQYGVKRGDSIDEARKKCAKLHTPHVELLGENRCTNREPYDRRHQKAILKRYREASRAIYQVLRSQVPICERAGVDEAYLDVTEEAIEIWKSSHLKSNYFCEDSVNRDTLVFGIDKRQKRDTSMRAEAETNDEYLEDEHGDEMYDTFPVTEEEHLLCIGATIARRIRQAIYDQLKYRCSTGIATNKLQAKIASPLNKPNGQTIVAPRFIALLMSQLRVQKVRGLGGKLGKQLISLYNSVIDTEKTQQHNLHAMESGDKRDEAKSNVTASEFLQVCSASRLISALGSDTAHYVQQILSGNDGDEPVDREKTDLKGFSSTKQFAPIGYIVNEEQLRYWFRILAEEVVDRLTEEIRDQRRFPVHITLHLSTSDRKSKCRRLQVNQQVTVDILANACYQSVYNDLAEIFPIAHLTIHAKDFIPFANENAKISSFFTKQTDECTVIDADDTQIGQTFLSTTNKPCSSKQNGIAKFLHATSPVKPDSSNHFHCEACDTWITTSIQEHEDYHFAKSLSSSQSQNPVPPLKRKAAGPMDAFLTVKQMKRITPSNRKK